MRRDLGAGDRVVLDNYLETVREIERRVQLASSRDLSGIEVPEAPIGELDAFGEQVDLMFDLIALAYRADLTRVASYIMVAEGTNRTYNHIGVSDSFHPVSHHANDLDRIEKLVKIQTWHMERFAAFVGKLAAIPDGDGTLLDHAMFLYGSNMSNSDRHNGHPLPTILVGGGNGTLRGGQHIDLPRADAARQPPPDDSRQGRRGAEVVRRQHGHDRGGVGIRLKPDATCRAIAAAARSPSRPRRRTRRPAPYRVRDFR